MLCASTIDKYCNTYENKRAMYKIRHNHAEYPDKKFDHKSENLSSELLTEL